VLLQPEKRDGTKRKWLKRAVVGTLAAGAVGTGVFGAWCVYARRLFSYDGERKLSRQIVEGTAEHVKLPAGGTGLDVGCGSGALTIAVAKRYPKAQMIGIDPWGPEYASFNKTRCEANAEAEGVTNVRFQDGNAIKLDFPDESFDAVTSNYVYHNIMGKNRQELLRESLRVLKKGGTFALHDIMSKARYGDMEAFAQSLRDEGYEKVELIETDSGLFMSQNEARTMFLKGSKLLTGIK
jgi:ubiquinone/menaquinone biosynthesis C-methylase UbiE